MKTKTELKKLLAALYQDPPKVTARIGAGLAGGQLFNNGLTAYSLETEEICKFYSQAETVDGRKIDTRTAHVESIEEKSVEDVIGMGQQAAVIYQIDGLMMRQELTFYENGMLTVQVFLHDDREQTETRFLVPFVTPYPDGEGKPLFLSLDQKMLLVPYDNDMWSRYESAVPACGRKSYDVTAVYEENSLEGLIIGALDFDVWKNAVCWSAHDARSLKAFCGASDAGTHDICPHAAVSGEWVASSRFVVFWTEDIRRGLEQYGDLCAALLPPRPWKNGNVPFGWNSYSALGMSLKLSHWQEAGDFMKKELPAYCDEEGVTYVNLDGAFGLDEEEIKRTVTKFHERGQKAGWYANPCNWFAAGADMPAEGTELTMGDLFLKDERGQIMPAADGTVPLDVTHPAWELMARTTMRRLIGLGIDYIKLDFLSHGSVEGAHYRKEYTGRMALSHAYRVLAEEIDRAEREIFVSLSIAPLFPYFLGNARRSCCDTFGHHEDVRYVLNALNFAWWTNGRLYRFNDPDHIPLYQSVIDKRETTTEAEARSRYYASVISGTVMMLSDNYGPEGNPAVIAASRERTLQFANLPEVNALARLGKAFVPVELKDGTTPFYTLNFEGRHFAAIFNFAGREETFSFAAVRGGLPRKGSWRDICGGACRAYQGQIEVILPAYDAVILEIFEKGQPEDGHV